MHISSALLKSLRHEQGRSAAFLCFCVKCATHVCNLDDRSQTVRRPRAHHRRRERYRPGLRRGDGEGAEVILSDIDEEAGRRAAAQVGGRFQVLDVCSQGDWERAMAAAVANGGGLDILVNNAGIGIGGDITKLTLADWQRQMAVNLDGTFLGMKHAFPVLRAARRSNGDAGTIINIASVTGIRGSAVFVGYAASKGGVIALTRSVDRQCALAKDGVRVNAIAPGVIDTPIFERMEGVDGDASDAAATAGRLVPLGRPGQPGDVAEAAVWLASDAARYVTGIVLPVDGGLLMG